MKRFNSRESKTGVSAIGWIMSFLLTAAIIVGVVIGTDSVGKASQQEQLESLKNSVIKSAVHCYAVEGAYPESLSDLEERYGLSYNSEEFFIDYRCVASNLMPEITVLKK